MGQFEFYPAQQAMGFIGDDIAGQIAMPAKHGQQITGGIVVGALLQLSAAAQWRLVDHGRAGMDQKLVVGVQECHGPHILLFQRLVGDAGQ